MDISKLKVGFIIALLAAVCYFVLAQQFGIVIWDEPAYLGNARDHFTHSWFTEDFRFPLLEYVIAGVWTSTGESIQIARIIMCLFSGLFILMTYLLAGLILDESEQRIATILVALNPLMIFWSFRIYTDIPAITAGMAALYFGIQYIRKRKKQAIAWFGFFSAIAFLFRFPLVLYAVPIGVYLLYKKRIKELSIGLGVSLLTLIPWLIYNSITYGNPLWDFFAQSSIIATYTTAQSATLFIPFLQAAAFPLVLGLLGIALYKKHNRASWAMLVVLGLQVVLHVFVVRLKLERYMLTILPLLIILSVYGWRLLVERMYPEKAYPLFGAIIIFCLLMMLVASDVRLTQMKYMHQCNDAVQEANKYLSKYPEGTVIISNQWPVFAYENNFNSTSMWTTYSDQLLWRMMPDKVILAYPGGLEQNLTAYQEHKWLQHEATFQSVCPEYSVHIFDMSWIDPTEVIYKGPLPD